MDIKEIVELAKLKVEEGEIHNVKVVMDDIDKLKRRYYSQDPSYWENSNRFEFFPWLIPTIREDKVDNPEIFWPIRDETNGYVKFYKYV